MWQTFLATSSYIKHSTISSSTGQNMASIFYLSFCFAILLDNGKNIVESQSVRFEDSTAYEEHVAMNSSMPRFVTAESYRNFSRGHGYSARKTLLVLPASISYSGSFPLGPMCTKAMEVALDRLHDQQDWLRNYELVIELIDDKCDASETISQALSKLMEDSPGALNRVPTFVSLGCDVVGQRTVGEIAKFFNIINLSFTQNSPELLTDRQRFSSFFAIGPTGDLAHRALADFISQMGWRTVAIVSERSSLFDMVEQKLFEMLSESRITLSWIGKFSNTEVDEEELNEGFSQMKYHDPRVIIINADLMAAKICWLYRYQMYGQNYVIFIYKGSDHIVPPSHISWCSQIEIDRVLVSSISFDVSTLADIHGFNVADVTGLSEKSFEAQIKNKIDHPEQSPFWNYWRSPCYDLVIYAGETLNTFEQYLSIYNQTIADWLLGSKNLKEKGTFEHAIMKQAVWDTDTNGFTGVFNFEGSTTTNSLGFAPVTFIQQQNRARTTVALHRGNNLTIYSDRIRWLTPNGLAPKDSITRIDIEVPAVPKVTFGFLSAIGIVEWIICCATIVIAVCLRKHLIRHFSRFDKFRLKAHNYFVIFGSLLMICGVFSIPLDSKLDIVRNCSALGMFLVAGYSASIFGIMAKLENGRLALEGEGHHAIREAVIAALGVAWTSVHSSLFGALLSASVIVSTKVNMALEQSPSDNSVMFRRFSYTCQLLLNNDHVAGIALIAVLTALHGLALLRAAIVSYEMKSKLNRLADNELKSTCICVYCVILLFIACGFISLLVNSWSYIVVACLVLCYVGISMGLTVYVKLPLGIKKTAPSVNLKQRADVPKIVVPSTRRNTEAPLGQTGNGNIILNIKPLPAESGPDLAFAVNHHQTTTMGPPIVIAVSQESSLGESSGLPKNGRKTM